MNKKEVEARIDELMEEAQELDEPYWINCCLRVVEDMR